jgi:hypothetical protein
MSEEDITGRQPQILGLTEADSGKLTGTGFQSCHVGHTQSTVLYSTTLESSL